MEHLNWSSELKFTEVWSPVNQTHFQKCYVHFTYLLFQFTINILECSAVTLWKHLKVEKLQSGTKFAHSIFKFFICIESNTRIVPFCPQT